MSEFSSVLKTAQERAIIDRVTADKLEALHGELYAVAPATGPFGELDQLRETDMTKASESSEAPRFIRGFHDVLITIGILIALGGLWALASVLAVLPGIVVLSEIFVKRQRLALPAFTLTVMLILAIGSLFGSLSVNKEEIGAVFTFVCMVGALAVYYWRYRVPIALAGLIWAGFGLVFFVLLSVFGIDDHYFDARPRLVALIGFVLSLGLFAAAMRFDLRDRMRTTRRSDVAFWLHLVTAPALIYSGFILIFGTEGFWWAKEPKVSEAIIAIAIVTVMVLIGIIIDRRAFVTSGLISLGAALAIITRETGVDVSSVSAFAFLAVGVIVLLLGAGWQKLRALVLTAMPRSWQEMLPPVDE